MAILRVGRTSSHCGGCGAGTDIAKTCTPIGYGTPPPSCGAVFTDWEPQYLGQEKDQTLDELIDWSAKFDRLVRVTDI